MKTSLIITTKNEEKSIRELLASISQQSILPDEVLIADASSNDKTIERIEAFDANFKISLIHLPYGSNRSVGRNAAINAAINECILITDAGCTLDKCWVENMCIAFQSTKHIDVVAGYYYGIAKHIFERCQIPYILVMPDRLNPKTFLPATRSMGLKKQVWSAMGGFNEKLRYGEDYAFARALKDSGFTIITQPKAVVGWKPRATFKSFERMIYEHAFGDAFSGTFRLKVALIFIRYLTLLIIIVLLCLFRLYVFEFLTVFILAFVYSVFSIRKNYRYVKDARAFLYLPLLQVGSDYSVLLGTCCGLKARKLG